MSLSEDGHDLLEDRPGNVFWSVDWPLEFLMDELPECLGGDVFGENGTVFGGDDLCSLLNVTVDRRLKIEIWEVHGMTLFCGLIAPSVGKDRKRNRACGVVCCVAFYVVEEGCQFSEFVGDGEHQVKVGPTVLGGGKLVMPEKLCLLD